MMLALIGTFAVAAAPAAAKTRFCARYTYPSGPALNVYSSSNVLCAFARKNARAVYNRRRCAKGWRYKRISGIRSCTRKGRVYFALPAR